MDEGGKTKDADAGGKSEMQQHNTRIVASRSFHSTKTNV